jgi:hypothetical protein
MSQDSKPQPSKFSDFKIEPTYKKFVGEKIRLAKVLNVEIIVRILH